MTVGVLLMAYGSPSSPEEVGPYLAEVRGGRSVEPALLDDVAERYARLDGPSPLNEITRRQAAALEAVLNADGVTRYAASVGMKHWHPFIAEAVERIAAAGADPVIGLALAPHYSSMSIGGYEERVRRAREACGASFEFHMVRAWYEEPAFVAFVAGNLRATLGADDGSTRVVFTAHSLPERIVAEGDPYREQLLESAASIASAAGVADWEFAFQSASATGVPWLGPDVLDRLDAIAAAGVRRVVLAPVGFVTDHLEILYDLDIGCAQRARGLGLELRRIPSPNDHPAFIAALAAVVRRAAERIGAPA